ncbi:MAG: hypothetical protein ACMVP2_24720 [Imperialibacter sp.]|uniref:hypothetical protein n=1 Tax=Imperialibacter sp. TaxID=2038411 RepID=UPI003A859F0F
MISENDRLKKLLAKKELTELDENFEEVVMDQVFREAKRFSVTHKYIRRMYVCFGVGFVLGLVAMFSISNLEVSLGEWELTIPSFVLQVPFVLLILFLVDRLYKARQFSRGEMDVFND